MMAKNEIKMLLLGAGESGKVGGVAFPALEEKEADALSLVNCAQANEAYSSWRLQRIGT